MNNEPAFEDVDSYGSGLTNDKLTFREIILQHLKKITALASIELRGGYWNERYEAHSNTPIRTYVPDGREAYCNAIDVLSDLLLPYYDEVMAEAEQTTSDETDSAFKDSNYPTGEDDSQSNNLFLFRVKKQRIKRKLFRALCCFLHRKKYLELGEVSD